ncbi:MAG: hypothetical protein KBC84_06480 [Proteobacteria bacterium]|nr:hypothetical protein [Pseudomonadota bacterium]
MHSNRLIFLVLFLTIGIAHSLSPSCYAEENYNQLHQNLEEILKQDEFKDRKPAKSFSDSFNELKRRVALYIFKKIFDNLPLEEAAAKSERYGEYFLFSLKCLLVLIVIYTLYQLYRTFGPLLWKKKKVPKPDTIKTLGELNTKLISESDLDRLIKEKKYQEILVTLREKLREELITSFKIKLSSTDRELVNRSTNVTNIKLFADVSRLFEEVAFAGNSLDEQRLINFFHIFRAK